MIFWKLHHTLTLATTLFLLGTAPTTATAQNVRLAFYNVENLLDTLDNPATRDDEFTPLGMKRWNTPRFYQKIRQLSKAIMSLGEWEGLGILALAEVENRKVVEDLINYSPLRTAQFKIVHFDSPDARGIDVALLYRPDKFTLVAAKPIQVNLPTGRTTRDILHVKGLIGKTDTLNIFVNHWPSRWGGQVNSEPRRIFVATFLRNYIENHLRKDENIVILGDLNDGPHDKSVYEALGAKEAESSAWLVNLMLNKENGKKIGTHAHQGVWEALDQIIVSRRLLDGTSRLQVENQRARVHKPAFMLKENNGGYEVLRSYRGARYEGGFSDHLPVYIDLVVRHGLNPK